MEAIELYYQIDKYEQEQPSCPVMYSKDCLDNRTVENILIIFCKSSYEYHFVIVYNKISQVFSSLEIKLE